MFQIKLLFILTLNLFYLHTSVFANSSKFSRFSRHTNSESSSRRTQYSSSDDGFLNSVQLSWYHAFLAHSLALSLALSHHTAQQVMLDPVNDCLELLDDRIDMSRIVTKPKDHVNDDVHTWLSAALTNQETCKQRSLSEKTSLNKDGITIDSVARNLTGLRTKSLDMFISTSRPETVGRKLLSKIFRRGFLPRTGGF
ncbi:unnamed protein product [Eruca vesicaria subsp. sativa]|uniref:Pectinesterase inhibitor domain-containing protein n=1 Tax=Eruca vesicaria subsp. sativa TaxID=29727 RepID=A0ABC8L8U3_ERUVS|nr:unnamed protein product [Eruca vesicaria subsp. sativa]